MKKEEIIERLASLEYMMENKEPIPPRVRNFILRTAKDAIDELERSRELERRFELECSHEPSPCESESANPE